ncbi:polyamine aminopropyltransferase [bacterium]|nr:polyamine aminopropyltransferase [bacterium]
MNLNGKTIRSPKALVAVLGISMLFVGICGISYEYTFSRLASDILGNSVKQWAIIIGLMMLFMGIGADLQKYFPDKYNVDNFVFFEIILGLLGGLGPSITLYAFGNMHDHFILIHYFFICSIGLLIGLEIPLLTRVNEMAVPSLKRNLGLILKMDYIGSFIGALVWVFILPRFFNVLEISFFLGIVNVVVALFAWVWFSPWMQYPRIIPAFAVASLVILTVGLFNGKTITITAEQKLYRDPIVYTRTTMYQRIVITKNYSGDLYFYINGHLQFSSLDEYIYHEFLVHPAMAAVPKKQNILVLGGGDGLAVREILKYKEVHSVTLVDIDPEVTRLAATNADLVKMNGGSLTGPKVKIHSPEGIEPGEKVSLTQFGQGHFKRFRSDDSVEIHLYHIDAFKFVESISGIFDVIVIDFPDANHVELAKLYSLEFYTMLKHKLAFDGLIIQQSSNPALAKEVFLVVGRSMEAAGFRTLPLHQTVPSFGDWGWWIAGHEERYGPETLKRLVTDSPGLPDDVQYITRNLILASQQFGKNGLTTDNTDLNTLLNKRIFYYYEQALEKMRQ